MQVNVLISVQPDGGSIKPYLTVAVSIDDAVESAYQILKDARIPFSAVSGCAHTSERLDVYA